MIVKDEENSLFILTKPFPAIGNHTLPAPTGGLPTLHPYRLSMVAQKWKLANIFVCHSGDLFGEWIPTDWILQVFEAAKAAPWHNYLFLAVNPSCYTELLEACLPVQADNFWYGTRLTEKGTVFTADGYHTFICMEPMGVFSERMEIPHVEWILLGGYGRLRRKWIESVIERKGNIPVFMVNSELLQKVWAAPLVLKYPSALLYPKEKDLPRYSKCQYCYSKQQGKSGEPTDIPKSVCEDKKLDGRHIDGRFARVSPQWCPKRTGTNWRDK